MDKISNVRGRKILNSRGIPTIEVEVEAEGVKGRASIPEGKSVGKYEAVSLPPEEAIENIKEKIAPAIIGKEANFKEIDGELIKMDGTENKSNLGANTILGISLACARVQAKLEKKSLFDFLSQFFSSEPKDRKEIDLTLLMNIVNGGMHAFGGPDIQEYHIVIKGENIEESIFLGAEIYREMRKFFKGNIGDEGGLVPRFNDNQFPLEAISRVIAEKQVRRKVRLGLDVAASQLFDGEKYKLRQLPSGFNNQSARLLIGAGCLVNPSILEEEMKITKTHDRVGVDAHCAIIKEEHIIEDRTSKHLSKVVGSTGGLI